MSETQNVKHTDKDVILIAIEALEKQKAMATNISRTNYGLFQQMTAHCNRSIMTLKKAPAVVDHFEAIRQEGLKELAEQEKPETPNESTDTEQTQTVQSTSDATGEESNGDTSGNADSELDAGDSELASRLSSLKKK